LAGPKRGIHRNAMPAAIMCLGVCKGASAKHATAAADKPRREGGGWNGGLMYARKATYTYAGDAHDIAQKAEQGMLAILRSQPGFKAYSVFSTGDEIISISGSESTETAETANTSVAKWVADNLSDQIPLQDAEICEIHFSTPLRISTKDWVTA